MSGDTDNGHSPNGRVPFGDAPGNSLPADWVEPLLRKLFDTNRQAFSRALAEVATEQMTGVTVAAQARRPSRS